MFFHIVYEGYEIDMYLPFFTILQVINHRS